MKHVFDRVSGAILKTASWPWFKGLQRSALVMSIPSTKNYSCMKLDSESRRVESSFPSQLNSCLTPYTSTSSAIGSSLCLEMCVPSVWIGDPQTRMPSLMSLSIQKQRHALTLTPSKSFSYSSEKNISSFLYAPIMTASLLPSQDLWPRLIV